jgi:hypothetical protein
VVFGGEQPAHVAEDLVTVRPSDDEPKEVADLTVEDSDAAARFLAERSNLSIHDIAQAEATRDGLSGVLVLEELSRQIPVPKDLEELERHHGLHPPLARLTHG